MNNLITKARIHTTSERSLTTKNTPNSAIRSRFMREKKLERRGNADHGNVGAIHMMGDFGGTKSAGTSAVLKERSERESARQSALDVHGLSEGPSRHSNST